MSLGIWVSADHVECVTQEWLGSDASDGDSLVDVPATSSVRRCRCASPDECQRLSASWDDRVGLALRSVDTGPLVDIEPILHVGPDSSDWARGLREHLGGDRGAEATSIYWAELERSVLYFLSLDLDISVDGTLRR